MSITQMEISYIYCIASEISWGGKVRKAVCDVAYATGRKMSWQQKAKKRIGLTDEKRGDKG